MLYRLKQLICPVRGLYFQHDFRVKYQSGRMYLCCIECGKESRGWNLKSRKSEAESLDENVLVRFRQLIRSSLARIEFW